MNRNSNLDQRAHSRDRLNSLRSTHTQLSGGGLVPGAPGALSARRRRVFSPRPAAENHDALKLSTQCRTVILDEVRPPPAFFVLASRPLRVWVAR